MPFSCQTKKKEKIIMHISIVASFKLQNNTLISALSATKLNLKSKYMQNILPFLIAVKFMVPLLVPKQVFMQDYTPQIINMSGDFAARLVNYKYSSDLMTRYQRCWRCCSLAFLYNDLCRRSVLHFVDCHFLLSSSRLGQRQVTHMRRTLYLFNQKSIVILSLSYKANIIQNWNSIC